MSERLLTSDEVLGLENRPLDGLLADARRVRAAQHGSVITFSPKVFIPLTVLCRDVCHYCTFAKPPRRGERAYLSREEVLAVAAAGAEAGCHEALFTLGDKPERRYRRAREELERLGHDSTLSYLAECAQLVLEETGLLPHLNPGVMEAADLAHLRSVSASMGIMLETGSDRLSARGGPHFGSPDKLPELRLGTLRRAGELAVPFTTGILIGIGETRAERLEALLQIRELHHEYGHIQEVIVQNFRAKPDTRMADHPEPSFEDLMWTTAAARLTLDPEISVQVPPNLSYSGFPELL
ncbi:MAG: 7,8-didemethyl-8-hydroxy-5-deazariboflavin synthase CofG, partial [Gaiellales bacterium]